MVPLIDMVNHQSYVAGCFSDLSDLGEHMFSTWATECVAEGGEVFQSYGSARLSPHFLLYYGFLPDGNEAADVITFRLSDQLCEFLPAASKYQNGKWSKPGWYLGHAGVDGHINEGYIAAYAMYIELDPAVVIPAGESATRLALVFTLAALRRAQAAFTATLEEDEARLADNNFAGADGLGFDYPASVACKVRVRTRRLMRRVQINLVRQLRHHFGDRFSPILSSNNPPHTVRVPWSLYCPC